MTTLEVFLDYRVDIALFDDTGRVSLWQRPQRNLLRSPTIKQRNLMRCQQRTTTRSLRKLLR